MKTDKSLADKIVLAHQFSSNNQSFVFTPAPSAQVRSLSHCLMPKILVCTSIWQHLACTRVILRPDLSFIPTRSLPISRSAILKAIRCQALSFLISSYGPHPNSNVECDVPPSILFLTPSYRASSDSQCRMSFTAKQYFF